MKYSAIQVAKIVGTTRQTVSRHIKSGVLSAEKDEDGNNVVDASEIIRVYQGKANFDALHDDSGNVTSGNATSVTTKDTTVTDLVAEEKLNTASVKIEMLEEQMRRERELLQNQIQSLQTALEKSQDGQNKLTLLLEHKESEGAGDWKKAMKAVEARVANQEKENKEEKERAQKILRQNQQLKKALEAEKSKSLWQKLFG
jgi:hypothetical protein